jgi:hypothetical protein
MGLSQDVPIGPSTLTPTAAAVTASKAKKPSVGDIPHSSALLN